MGSTAASFCEGCLESPDFPHRPRSNAVCLSVAPPDETGGFPESELLKADPLVEAENQLFRPAKSSGPEEQLDFLSTISIFRGATSSFKMI